MKKSRHILIPIDFNDSSRNIVEYVAHWMGEGDKISLLHVVSYGYGGLEVTQKHGPFGELEVQLKALCSAFSDTTTCSVLVEYNPLGPTDSISRYVREHHVDMLFIARHEKHDLIENWLGSTSLGAVKTVNCDVIVVPSHFRYNPWETIILAAGPRVSEVITDERLESWAGKRVLFVHVDSNTDEAYENEKKALLSSLFDESNVGFAFGIDTVKSDNKVNSILSFAQNEKADVIAIQKSDQSLISTLFLKSTTKEIIEKATLPLIFIN